MREGTKGGSTECRVASLERQLSSDWNSDLFTHIVYYYVCPFIAGRVTAFSSNLAWHRFLRLPFEHIYFSSSGNEHLYQVNVFLFLTGTFRYRWCIWTLKYHFTRVGSIGTPSCKQGECEDGKLNNKYIADALLNCFTVMHLSYQNNVCTHVLSGLL